MDKRFNNMLSARALAQQRYIQRNPWMVAYTGAKNRCENPKNQAYKRYGGRGIKFYLTVAEIKDLWFRDGADKMKKPSIDREKVDGHYEFSNCRFIEQTINCKKDRIKPVLQLTETGYLIKRWNSVTEAANTLKLSVSKISAVCRGQRQTTGSYYWSFAK